MEWYNGETVYYPSFDSFDLVSQWDYHPENEAVQNLINANLAFKTKEEAQLCAVNMYERYMLIQAEGE